MANLIRAAPGGGPSAAAGLIIAGASARAASFSALRAGLRPFALDLFGDLDLRAAAPAQVIAAADYPGGIPRLLEALPPLPVIYTGGLENHPEVVAAMASGRPLLGNAAPVLRAARDPLLLQGVLRAAGLRSPGLRAAGEPPPDPERWLEKPLAGAGGRGIRKAGRGEAAPGCFFQERIDGRAASAVYLAAPAAVRLLGATLQLAGTAWLGAPPFAYSGSIGPLALAPALRGELEAAGEAVARAFALRGLFGLDFILDGAAAPWVIELNPRYTASVEVIEHALGLAALDLHRRAFEGAALEPAPPPPPGPRAEAAVIGKGILYAPGDLRVRVSPPLTLEPWTLPRYADCPPAGLAIAKGRPVMTLFASAATAEECLGKLEAEAAAAAQSFFGSFSG
jgi:predicted ATP-grasp superfamily ATP-dependent carboligase